MLIRRRLVTVHNAQRCGDALIEKVDDLRGPPFLVPKKVSLEVSLNDLHVSAEDANEFIRRNRPQELRSAVLCSTGFLEPVNNGLCEAVLGNARVYPFLASPASQKQMPRTLWRCRSCFVCLLKLS